MPYIKKKPVDPLRKLLKSYELTGETLARLIGTSPSTGARRLRTPEDLTVRELRSLSRKGHISIDEIRAAL